MVAVEIGLLAWLSPSDCGLPPSPPPKNENITQRPPSGRWPAIESALMVPKGPAVARAGPRRRGAKYRRVGHHKRDRPQAARIGRHAGEDVLERHVAGRDGGGARDVDWPLRRFRRARKVENHALAGDR